MHFLMAIPAWMNEYANWMVAALIVIVGLVWFGWADLTRLHGRRIWAISSVCFTEALRKRILWVTPLAIAGVITVSQLSRPIDAQDAIRQATKYCLFASGLLVTVTAVILACTNLPREIESRVIYTIVTKPVTRLEIVLGKVLGFARVSAAIILVMGIFTYAYLQARNHLELAQLRRQLTSLPANSTLRVAMQHDVDRGLLRTENLEATNALEILGRAPGPPGSTSWMQGVQGEYFLVPFLLTPEQRDQLSAVSQSKSAAFIMTTLRIEQRTPDAIERRMIKDMNIQALGNTKRPTTAPIDDSTPPPPHIAVRVLDKSHRPITGGETGWGDNIALIKPDTPGGAWFAPLAMPSDMLDKLAGPAAGEFFVQVTGVSPATDYGADEAPVALLVPSGEPENASSMGPQLPAAAPKLAKIFPPPDKSGKLKYTPPEFLSYPAQRGMRLEGHAAGNGPLAVYHFEGAKLNQILSGKVSMQFRLNVERIGDVDPNTGYSLVQVQIVNHKTGKAIAPFTFAPEINQARYIDLPAADLEGGSFDVMLRGLVDNQWLGVSPTSVAIVAADQSFIFNLFKSLLLLWLLSVLVVIIAVFCSTFLSWPIAVVCTLLILLGHWGVMELGDALRPGLGHAITQEFKVEDTGAQYTLSSFIETLAWILRGTSNLLPDVSQFPVTDYIESGISIPIAAIGGALGVLCCYGLPMLVLGYVILRKKEVAP
jgi:ABC-type transport system involved in multi-copper enzyme maturation permease subunit